MIRILGAMFLTTVACLCNAQSIGGIAKVAVIDTDTGTALVPHLYRGEYWVAAVPGARYCIEVRNRMGERLLVVASVDGVNVVSGETAFWDQVGYVFDPGERYQISGWRKSDSDVAAFTFTSLPNSYAARTGRAANVGVIGVAMFRERQLPRLSIAPRERMSDDPIGGLRDSAGTAAAAETPPAVDAPAAPAVDAAASAGVEVTGQRVPMLRAPTSPMPEAKLGTGHGEREYSYVSHTQFIRLTSRPNELIRIHYDSLENLVALGIIRPPPLAPPTGNPFPGSPNGQYVPDPPG